MSTRHFWLNPKWSQVSCETCGAKVGDPCLTNPNHAHLELNPIPHADRITKLVQLGVVKDEDAGPYPYTGYLNRLAHP